MRRCRGGGTIDALRRVPHQNLAWRGTSFCHSISIHTGVYCHLRRGSVNLRNIITDKENAGIFSCDVGFFSIVKYVSHGFFPIQILPKPITTGGEYGTPFPTTLNAFGVSQQ